MLALRNTEIPHYIELCKPNVIALMLLTSLVGMLLASPGWVSVKILVFGNLGIGLVASAGAAFNHILDRQYDALMHRTRYRPIPLGRLPLYRALTFAFTLTITGFVLLHWIINPLTAWLTLASMVGYAGIYTLFLKHATSQNIVIGGLAGAMPPLLGWIAVTNSISLSPIILVLIIFTWTPPHFWALAIHRHKEYAKANIPMLPVTHGIPYTKLQVFIYSILLLIVSIIPYMIALSGRLYLFGSFVLGSVFIYNAYLLWRKDIPKMAMTTFRYSIIYLMLLFTIMLVDHYWRF